MKSDVNLLLGACLTERSRKSFLYPLVPIRAGGLFHCVLSIFFQFLVTAQVTAM